MIQFQTTDTRQIVELGIEEQTVEQLVGLLLLRRLTRTRTRIYLDTRSLGALAFVDRKRAAQLTTDVQTVVVEIQNANFVDPALAQVVDDFGRNLLVAFQKQLARFFIVIVFCRNAFAQRFKAHAHARHARFVHLAECTGIVFAFLAHQNIARARIENVEIGALIEQETAFQGAINPRRVDRNRLGFVEHAQQIFRRIAQCAKQNRRIHLSTTVDSNAKHIFRIEFKIEPRATIRNDASREAQLARRRRRTIVVAKKRTRTTVQLAHDDALRTIDDKRSLGRHERNRAKINLLLLNIAYATAPRRRIDVVNRQAHVDFDRRFIRHATRMALFHVVFRLF